MPCTDGGPSRVYNSYPSGLSLEEIEAMLCAALRFIGNNHTYFMRPTELLDHQEAGVSPDNMNLWWDEHLEKDRKGRAAEAEARRINNLRRDALEKLSPEERKALGIS